MSSTVPSVIQAGEVVSGKYRLVRRLGKGGMGSVWEAHHGTIRRRFAIKFLLPDLAAKDDMRRRFELEAKSAGAIECEHVVAVLDHGVTEAGQPFIVMEYLDGEDLGCLVEREGRLATFRTADLVLQAASGLARAHGRGIVHRDLKPQNLFILLRENGTELCKVLDFGVALDRSRASALVTNPGQLVGTLDYMSPEQLRGDPNVDARTDVYSLGCVLYECLAGRRPFIEDQPHVLMQRILQMDAPRLEELRPGLLDGLPELVHRALHKDPERRFQSMAELADALAPFASHVPARERRAFADAATVASEPDPSSRSATGGPRPRSRVATVRWMAVAAIVAVGAIGALLVTRTRQTNRQGVDVSPAALESAPSNLARAPSSVVDVGPNRAVAKDAPTSAGSSPAPVTRAAPEVPEHAAALASATSLSVRPPRRRERTGPAKKTSESEASAVSGSPISGRKRMPFDLTTDPYPQ